MPAAIVYEEKNGTRKCRGDNVEITVAIQIGRERVDDPRRLRRAYQKTGGNGINMRGRIELERKGLRCRPIHGGPQEHERGDHAPSGSHGSKDLMLARPAATAHAE